MSTYCSLFACPIMRHGNAVTLASALQCVGELWSANMPFVFSHVEYCDMHFVYRFCDGNANAAVEEYRRRYPERRIPSRGVFTRVHQTFLLFHPTYCSTAYSRALLLHVYHRNEENIHSKLIVHCWRHNTVSVLRVSIRYKPSLCIYIPTSLQHYYDIMYFISTNISYFIRF